MRLGLRAVCHSAVIAVLFTVHAPARSDEADLKAAAARTGQLTRMAEITKLAGLDGASAGLDTKLTIFAPTDAAFEALPEHFRVAIVKPENRSYLVDLLLHHAVIGQYRTRTLLRASAMHYGVEAIDGSSIEFTIRHGLDVHGAKITEPDIVASNGILHVIDKVLVPRAVMAAIEAQTGQRSAAVEDAGVRLVAAAR